MINFVTFLVLIYVAKNINIVESSHFRGGLITWEPIGNQTVNITYRLSFNQGGNHLCSFIGEPVTGEGTFDCFAGCSGEIESRMSYFCTDYSVNKNWLVGQKTVNFTFPETSENIFQIRYTGSSWITLVTSGNSWSLIATVNLNPRQDNGKINTPPTCSMSATVIIQQGCSYTLNIPVHDGDTDIVKCRWANNTQLNECGNVCNALPASFLNETSCILSYTASGVTGNYAVALQIEDFVNTDDSTALSSIPLQFVVQVIPSYGSCDSNPLFHELTLPDASTVYAMPNMPYIQTVIARSGSSNSSIKDVHTILPTGMTRSNLQVYGKSGREWYIIVTWAPSEEQIGRHDFCYVAIDNNGLTSPMSCITIQVTVLNYTLV